MENKSEFVRVLMWEISFLELELFFAAFWILSRMILWIRQRNVNWNQEAVLLLMYINIAVIIRFTFFPMSHVNGNVPIDNNRVENAIRPFAVGRKNWLFSNTANGAKDSAAIYSVIATAQANGLDTEAYLTELFSQPAGTLLMPWRSQNEQRSI